MKLYVTTTKPESYKKFSNFQETPHSSFLLDVIAVIGNSYGTLIATSCYVPLVVLLILLDKQSTLDALIQVYLQCPFHIGNYTNLQCHV